ncbi:hypothetical protein ACFPM0_23485 [Pseudonocardia sulfidoxydans]
MTAVRATHRPSRVTDRARPRRRTASPTAGRSEGDRATAMGRAAPMLGG